jgi:Kinesin-associated protein (KAP)
MSSLDEYIEQLYEEDTAAKIQGLGMIAQLFRSAANLEELVSKSGLLQLLARTLREEAKKSMDLAINAISVFFSMSNFSKFHGLVMDNQVGAMTMDLITLEVQRTAVRTREHGISPAEIAQKVCCTGSCTCMICQPRHGIVSEDDLAALQAISFCGNTS